MFLLLIGYRRTGKDTLCRHILHHKGLHSVETLGYKIWPKHETCFISSTNSLNNTILTNPSSVSFQSYKNFKPITLSTSLKLHVFEKLFMKNVYTPHHGNVLSSKPGLSTLSLTEKKLEIIERLKDKRLDLNTDRKYFRNSKILKNLCENRQTIRDKLIEQGKLWHMTNPYMCCSMELQKIIFSSVSDNPSKTSDELKNTVYIVTDIRFRHELEFFKKTGEHLEIPVKTVRLFRKEVAVPLMIHKSEHELDDVKTSLVLHNDWEKCCHYFPQYK